MSLVLNHSRAVGTDKVVLLGIAEHADKTLKAWPSVSTLARYANVHPRNVKRTLKKLQLSGDLRIDIQGGGTADLSDDQRPNLYTIRVSCPTSCDGSPQHRLKALPRSASDLWIDRVTPASPGDASVTRGVTPASRGGGDASVTQTVIREPERAKADRSVTGTRERCSICGRSEPACRDRAQTSGHTFIPPARESA